MHEPPANDVVDRLVAVDPITRDHWLGRLGEPGAHAAAMQSLPAMHQIEVGGSQPVSRTHEPETIAVIAWNLERGTHVDAAAAIIGSHRANVVLASEVDVGMARSGNRHTAADLAGALGHQYAFGVEFVELDLGDAQERASLRRDATNAGGFHGNAITADRLIEDPILIRIEQRGSWFATGGDQPRIGGRMALAARVTLDERPVVVASVHLESESDPALRHAQLATVLDAIELHYGSLPAVIGGDLNTFSAPIHEARTSFRSLRDADPSRWCWPVPYEPLFEAAAQHGFDIERANPREQTMRLTVDQAAGALLRLDWLLVRDLDVVTRSTVAAIGPDGAILSDHDGVAATVRHAPRQ